ncbi:PASTA domain-containing protein [Polymorphospora sp. NPDC050346]|uniref:PASTA domain-containing protein n=1 Tax=Polymorphospora sp. NPDC050346 TaxID=3155780 RepID=UPI0033EE73A4
MADEPRDGVHPPDRSDGAPDQTRPFDPVTDDDGPDVTGGPAAAARPGGPDATTVHGAGPDADSTAPLPAGDDRTARLGDDRTAQFGGGDRVGGDVWSGRAGVPPPGAAPRTPAPATVEQVEWDEVDRGPRRWWLPIVAGVVALLLLAVLGFGIWLIVGSTGDDGGPVTPSPSATTGSPSPSPSPTSAAPTTASASPSPSEPETVEVPPVLGLPEAVARGLLDQFGLTYGLEFRDSDEAPGTVIEVQPGVGTEVPPGEQVTLVIAQAPAPTVTPTVSPTPSVTPGG